MAAHVRNAHYHIISVHPSALDGLALAFLICGSRTACLWTFFLEELTSLFFFACTTCRILGGILASCAVVVAIASMAEDHLRSEARKRTFALHSAATASGSGGEEGKRVKLTPRLAREILDLPEGDQKELVMRPGNQVKQMHILEHVVLSADEHADEDNGSDDGGKDHREGEHHGLEEHHAHHDASPAQMRVQRQWALIFVTAIATASVVFETLKEITIERTPPTMIRVCTALHSTAPQMKCCSHDGTEGLLIA